MVDTGEAEETIGAAVEVAAPETTEAAEIMAAPEITVAADRMVAAMVKTETSGPQEDRSIAQSQTP